MIFNPHEQEFTLDEVLGLVSYALDRSPVDKYDLARALLGDQLASAEARSLVDSISGHYYAAAIRFIESELARRKRDRERTQKQNERKWEREMYKMRGRVMRELFSMSPEELLHRQRQWISSHPPTEQLMKEKPKGLGVNTPD